MFRFSFLNSNSKICLIHSLSFTESWHFLYRDSTYTHMQKLSLVLSIFASKAKLLPKFYCYNFCNNSFCCILARNNGLCWSNLKINQIIERLFGSNQRSKLRGTRSKSRNSAVKSSQLRRAGQYKKVCTVRFQVYFHLQWLRV